jgi:hypothetical protein
VEKAKGARRQTAQRERLLLTVRAGRGAAALEALY